MMKGLVKIDRVASVEEADLLRELCVDLISIPFFKSSVFNDERYVSIELGHSIIEAFGVDRCVAEISIKDISEEKLNQLISSRIQYIQPVAGEVLSMKHVNSLLDKGFRVICSNIFASNDE